MAASSRAVAVCFIVVAVNNTATALEYNALLFYTLPLVQPFVLHCLNASY